MKRKYPSSLVPAIANVYGDEDFTITYIGDGEDKKQIVSKAKYYKCINKTVFTGRIPREDIFQHLDKSDVFIMISKIETFGLVYLEAMSRGCIVVASRNEGMDGIIENGINGFLCEAGNEKELEQIVRQIKNMTMEQLNRLSIESIKTAKKYTDFNVAKEYIESIDK
jgi:glycosyltransferase involved in cell wall biosynthesis